MKAKTKAKEKRGVTTLRAEGAEQHDTMTTTR